MAAEGFFFFFLGQRRKLIMISCCRRWRRGNDGVIFIITKRVRGFGSFWISLIFFSLNVWVVVKQEYGVRRAPMGPGEHFPVAIVFFILTHHLRL